MNSVRAFAIVLTLSLGVFALINTLDQQIAQANCDPPPSDPPKQPPKT